MKFLLFTIFAALIAYIHATCDSVTYIGDPFWPSNDDVDVSVTFDDNKLNVIATYPYVQDMISYVAFDSMSAVDDNFPADLPPHSVNPNATFTSWKDAWTSNATATANTNPYGQCTGLEWNQVLSTCGIQRSATFPIFDVAWRNSYLNRAGNPIFTLTPAGSKVTISTTVWVVFMQAFNKDFPNLGYQVFNHRYTVSVEVELGYSFYGCCKNELVSFAISASTFETGHLAVDVIAHSVAPYEIDDSVDPVVVTTTPAGITAVFRDGVSTASRKIIRITSNFVSTTYNFDIEMRFYLVGATDINDYITLKFEVALNNVEIFIAGGLTLANRIFIGESGNAFRFENPSSYGRNDWLSWVIEVPNYSGTITWNSINFWPMRDVAREVPLVTDGTVVSVSNFETALFTSAEVAAYGDFGFHFRPGTANTPGPFCVILDVTFNSNTKKQRMLIQKAVDPSGSNAFFNKTFSASPRQSVVDVYEEAGSSAKPQLPKEMIIVAGLVGVIAILSLTIASVVAAFVVYVIIQKKNSKNSVRVKSIQIVPNFRQPAEIELRPYNRN